MVFAFSCLQVELAKLTKNEHSPAAPCTARGLGVPGTAPKAWPGPFLPPLSELKALG